MSGGLLVGAVVVVFAAGLAALVAAGETALTRISRPRAESLVADGRIGAPVLVEVLRRRPAALAPLWLLRVVLHLVIATVVAVLSVDRVDAVWLPLVVAGEVVVLLVLVEVGPRFWALRNLDTAARRTAPIVRRIVRFAPGRLGDPAAAPVVSEDEVLALAEAAAAGAAIDVEEQALIESVFALGDTIVREVMVPRTDMVTVSSDDTISQALDIAIDRGLSRLPICGEGIDDIIGVGLVKDLTRAERAGQGDRSVRSLMRRARFVPETKHADDLLREMQAGHHHLAVVVDEYGGTAGLVTLEDVVEELVGEIVDEFDVEEPLVEPLAGGEAMVHGRMPVDQLNALIDAELSDGDSDTVGGLIFNSLGHLPSVGESIEAGGVVLRVEQMEGRRITRVRLTPVDLVDAADPATAEDRG